MTFQKEHIVSIETRQKISMANKGKSNHREGTRHSPETRKKISEANKKQHHSLESIQRMSLSKKGISPWNKGKKGVYSLETINKMREAHKGKIAGMFGKHHTTQTKAKIGRSGNSNFNWRGGISFEPYSIDWRETLKRAVRERDNYICQVCNQYGDSIHHIDYNKKNCELDNLVTLCKRCHSKTNFERKKWIEYFSQKGGGI